MKRPAQQKTVRSKTKPGRSRPKKIDDAGLLVGIHSVASAIKNAPVRVKRVMIASESKNPRVAELGHSARECNITVQYQPRASLDQRCSDQYRHQDILAELAILDHYNEKDITGLLKAVEGDPLILVLDGVQDPHNFGACMRTAEAGGVNFVIAPRDNSSGMSPVVRRSAAGAAEVLPVVTVTNLARSLRELKSAGIWLVGATGEASQSLYKQGLGGPVALVMGSEGKGLRRLTAELCDYLIQIPMSGSVSSLNVSVATGVCLFEILRQRNLK